MTHFRVDIQLPLKYNPEEGGRMIPAEHFIDTYEGLLDLADGISTSKNQIIGSWINPKDKKRYDDKSLVFTVLVDSEDKMTITNASKIKELIEYKEKLKKRFKQHEIFIIASRCTWL